MTVSASHRPQPARRRPGRVALARLLWVASLAPTLGLGLVAPLAAQSPGIRSMSGSAWPDNLQTGRSAPAPTPPAAEAATAEEEAPAGPGDAPLPPPRPADLAPAAAPSPAIAPAPAPAQDQPIASQPVASGADSVPPPNDRLAPGLSRIAPLPPARPGDLIAQSTAGQPAADEDQHAETARPQVPSLSQPGLTPGLAPGASPDDGSFSSVAPLPPMRPAFPLDVQQQPAQAETAPVAPPVAQPEARKPAWWPFGKRDEIEEPLLESPSGLRTPHPTRTDAEVDACVARLRKAGAVVERIGPIANGSCGIRNGVRVIALPGGLPLSKPGTLSCAMVEATAEWLRGVAQPAARQHLRANITQVIIGPTYACRTMNHQRGAKISEHGYANAIDIAGFAFDSRRAYMVRPSHPTSGENLFQSFIRKNACRIFDTVIGPGGDRFHNDHLHLDLRNRGSGRQVCR